MAHSTASTDLVLDSDACTTTHSTLGIGLLILPLFSLSLSLSLSLSVLYARAPRSSPASSAQSFNSYTNARTFEDAGLS